LKRIFATLLCIVLLIGIIPAQAVAVPEERELSTEESLAADLKSLGLFKGASDTDFELGREPTRTEAIIMLIRLLGKESEALSSDCQHPFTDVEAWADKYIGYAYEMKLTKGSSDTEFGNGAATAGMYLTFVLRALGYSDADGDFTSDDPLNLAGQVGILPSSVNRKTFLRADAVLISYAALNATIKGSSQTLAQKLIASGVFTQEQFDLNYNIHSLYNKAVLTEKEIYEKCLSSMFYIKTYDIAGNECSEGSGFFTSESGVGFTTYSVMQNAAKAVVIFQGLYIEVEGIIDYSVELDYAAIQVDGVHFKGIKMGDSSTVKDGEKIYTVTSSNGLENAISNGLVSDACSEEHNGVMRISTPISPDGRGGPVINAYGEVVGIATSYPEARDNLTFALPINDILYDAIFPHSGIYSLETFLKLSAVSEYENAPQISEKIVYESEPNNDISSANPIETGYTMTGVIRENDEDVFLARCNTAGTIRIVSAAKSGEVNCLNNLTLIVKSKDVGGLEPGIRYETIDDVNTKTMEYEITKPGIYYMNLTSIYNQHTGYKIYYIFEPIEPKE